MRGRFAAPASSKLALHWLLTGRAVDTTRGASSAMAYWEGRASSARPPGPVGLIAAALRPSAAEFIVRGGRPVTGVGVRVRASPTAIGNGDVTVALLTRHGGRHRRRAAVRRATAPDGLQCHLTSSCYRWALSGWPRLTAWGQEARWRRLRDGARDASRLQQR